jgi:hypothetical protein
VARENGVSGTQPTAATPADSAVAIAKNGAQLVAILQQADPALYAQLVGSLATYSKSAAAPLIGAGLGLGIAKLGIGSYVTPEIQNLLTEALVALGTGAGAVVMHWWSKGPGRALQAPSALPVHAAPPTVDEIADAVIERLKHLPAEPARTQP